MDATLSERRRAAQQRSERRLQARSRTVARRQQALGNLARARGIHGGAGELQIEMPFNLPTSPVGAAPARSRRRSARRVALAQRLQALGVWAIGSLIVAALVALALLSVILNTVVIERSVELGKLDEARRTFRTENALLSAEIAKLSAPPRVVARAQKRLDMVPGTAMAQFIYLDPAAVREAKRKQRQAALRQAKVASAVTRGESILSGAVLLAPPGAEFGPRAVAGDGQQTGTEPAP